LGASVGQFGRASIKMPAGGSPLSRRPDIPFFCLYQLAFLYWQI
jgi:hypothetical protein